MKNFVTLLAAIALSWQTFAADLDLIQSGKIARAVGGIIGQLHYRQTPLDDAISEIFLQNYLDALDFNHLIFLQADVDKLRAKYAKNLDDLTLAGTVAPAHEIFALYLKRLTERQQFVERLCKEKYAFDIDESFIPNRQKLPWPKDEAEAETLWRQRVKFELLADRLSKQANGKPAAQDDETLKVISRRYSRLLKTMKEYDHTEILETYLTSMTHSYDPHSDYMSPAEAINFDINTIKLSLTGIGAVLVQEDGYTKIQRLMPGGPAARSKKLQANDRVVAVAQGDAEPVDVLDMKLGKVVDMIRGKKSTEVRLTIIPANAPDGSTKKIISIIRDEVKLADQLAKARVIERPRATGGVERLGVVNLPQFYENCAEDVETLIVRLKKEKIDGLVLDLRRNGGGILPEAVELAGLFIKEGPVVQVKDSRRRTQILSDENAKVTYDGPLIVAVGHMSASASEIVAAALQDYGRALIVGEESTHGKGTVQQLIPLNQTIAAGLGQDSGKLKFTISKFYRVSGGTTQHGGVSADLRLPSVLDHLDLGESKLPRALPADSINPARYELLNRVKPHLGELNRLSTERLGTDRDYEYVRQDIDRVKKQQADKSISLNETKRLQEVAAQKVQTEARKKERTTRPANGEKAYELTLDAAKTGKPLALVAAAKPETADPANGDDLEAAEPDSAADAPLRETLRILSDYARLLGAAAQIGSTPAK
ncbi:MAG: tail-specific protease [Pedosphaera sp.]|nr:tail-specific protease [Pedosphaera sp.]